ncbi:MAG: hypothetical protein AB7V18_09910 [Pyrinomonadaceae bacterium]
MGSSFIVSPARVAGLDYISEAPHGLREVRQAEVLEIVFRRLNLNPDKSNWSRQLRYERERGHVWTLDAFEAEKLADLLGESSNWRSFIRGLHPTKSYRRTIIFPGQKGRPEYACDVLSPENLLEGQPDPVSSRIQIYIDEVYYPERQEDGSVKESSGHYISIQPTAPYSDGAITLIADVDQRRILAINQYRYNAQCYMVEACRGFGDQDDISEEHTSEREREEETSIEKSRVRARKRLGYVHTDSGKLMEMPGYYLEFVDAPVETAKRAAKVGAMEDPVWIDLKRFYQAALRHQTINLEKHEYEFLRDEASRLKMNTRAPISNGTFEISDSFTRNAAFLAMPYILDHYHMTVNELLGL